MPPLLKYPGGLYYHQAWAVSLMQTPHIHAVHAFAGGLSELFAKPPELYENHSEMVNDANGFVANFWKHLLPEKVDEFKSRVFAIPFGRDSFNEAAKILHAETVSPMDRAVAFFVVARQSHAGNQKGFATASRTRTRRGRNEQVSAWLSSLDHIGPVAERLSRVFVENMQAQDLIRREDTAGTLFVLDPPWLETRAKNIYGDLTMTEEQHRSLLQQLTTIKGKFILFGYQTAMYDSFAEKEGWRRETKDVPSHMSTSKKKSFKTVAAYVNF